MNRAIKYFSAANKLGDGAVVGWRRLPKTVKIDLESAFAAVVRDSNEWKSLLTVILKQEKPNLDHRRVLFLLLRRSPTSWLEFLTRLQLVNCNHFRSLVSWCYWSYRESHWQYATLCRIHCQRALDNVPYPNTRPQLEFLKLSLTLYTAILMNPSCWLPFSHSLSTLSQFWIEHRRSPLCKVWTAGWTLHHLVHNSNLLSSSNYDACSQHEQWDLSQEMKPLPVLRMKEIGKQSMILIDRTFFLHLCFCFLGFKGKKEWPKSKLLRESREGGKVVLIIWCRHGASKWEMLQSERVTDSTDRKGGKLFRRRFRVP